MALFLSYSTSLSLLLFVSRNFYSFNDAVGVAHAGFRQRTIGQRVEKGVSEIEKKFQ